MDARRFDRNADQLAQIFWHLGRLDTRMIPEASVLRNELRFLIEQSLRINDQLAEMVQSRKDLQ